MLTAAQALVISQNSMPTEIVNSILTLVQAAAENGDRSIKYRGSGFGDSIMYSGEDHIPAVNRAVIKQLRDLGYQVRIRCEERQFVDLWLEVSW